MTQTEEAAAAPDAAASKPGLARVLGLMGAVLLTLSCITPASSLFIIVPEALAGQGQGAVLTLLAGVAISIAVGCCYAELGTRTPSSGGEYAMVTTVLGRFAGWLTFVLAATTLVIIPPVIALGTADYLADLFTVDRQLAGALVMLLATAMGIVDIKSNAFVTGIFLVIEVIAAMVVAGLGFAHTTNSPSVLVHAVAADDTGAASPFSLAMLMAGLTVAMFVVNGFGTASYLAEEIVEPRRNVARAVFWSLGLAAVIIVVPTIATVLAVGDPAALATGTFPEFVRSWSNDTVATAVSVGIAISILNAVIVMVLQNGRVVYASARDRAWPDPVSRALTKIHSRFGSPWVATLAISLPGAFLAYKVDIEPLLSITSVVVAVVSVVLAVAALRVRRLRGTDGWRMPLWPLPPLVVIAAVGYALTDSAPRDLLITAAIVAAGAVYYALFLRGRRATHWSVTTPED